MLHHLHAESQFHVSGRLLDKPLLSRQPVEQNPWMWFLGRIQKAHLIPQCPNPFSLHTMLPGEYKYWLPISFSTSNIRLSTVLLSCPHAGSI
jgi:hypothetical protein